LVSCWYTYLLWHMEHNTKSLDIVSLAHIKAKDSSHIS
jgi:hypothetical protein